MMGRFECSAAYYSYVMIYYINMLRVKPGFFFLYFKLRNYISSSIDFGLFNLLAL